MWKPIPSAPGYEATADGRIRSVQRGRPKALRLYPDEHGYLYFRRCYGGQRPWMAVAVAVAEAFRGPRPTGLQVRHLDGNPANNLVSNLAYGTVSENCYDQVRHGTHANAAKSHCKRNHPFDEANTYWYKARRNCRTCNRDRRRAVAA